jgi:hypothetical protein
MNRRTFLEGFLTTSAMTFGGLYTWQRLQDPSSVPSGKPALNAAPGLPKNSPFQLRVDGASGSVHTPGFKFTPAQIASVQPAEGLPSPSPAADPFSVEALTGHTPALDDSTLTAGTDADIKAELSIEEMGKAEVENYLRKMRNFDGVYDSDIYLDPGYEELLLRTATHMRRVEAYIGHGNFNLISFDEMLAAGRNFPAIGAFEKDELNFLEEVFFANPHRYGFYGKKISSNLTANISRKDVEKVSNSGHFLFKGDSLDLYNRIIKDVGSQVILTSGVRSNVKQMHLFLAKAIQANGNPSRASRSLAPPGHSYHGIGDFDIGKIGLGEKNFTSAFSDTKEYRRITSLGYVNFRYPTDNLLGVRFEPWHIKLG